MVEHNLAKVGVASSSLVFRSNEEAVQEGCFFSFDTTTRTKRSQTPLSGVGGVNINSRVFIDREAGSSLVFRSKRRRQLKAVFFRFVLAQTMTCTKLHTATPVHLKFGKIHTLHKSGSSHKVSKFCNMLVLDMWLTLKHTPPYRCTYQV